MAGPGGVYLPPVVAELTAEDGEFVRKIAAMKAMLAALAQQVTAMRVVADAGPFVGQLEALRTMAKAMELSIKVDADTLGAWAKIGALKGAAGTAAGGGFLSSLAGMFGGNILGKILWGGGSKGIGMGGIGGLGGFNFGAGLAGIGSIGSMAGFGLEHLLLTALGLAGSAAGGAIGAGLLGLGMLGTAGVGMGSDMLVAKSTIADTQAIAKAQDAYNKAVAIFGPNSRQAADAAKAYQYQLKLLGGASQVGVAAEIKLAAALNTMNAVWDRSTQGARAAFVNNLALPLVQLAQHFIPDVANAAQRNFGIMGGAIQPLFNWINTQGHWIFAQLENVFAKNLPIGVGIFVQSMELILRVMDRIATDPSFGSFLPKILAFVTRLNGVGFEGLMNHVNSMISLFHIWMALFVAAGRVLVDFFKPSVGLGTGIVQSLTTMLNQLDKWLNSATGKSQLKTVFQAHKDEVLALLKAIPPLIAIFSKIYLAAAPSLTRVATFFINIIVAVLEFINHLNGTVGAIAQWGTGLILLAAKFGLFNGPINALRKWLGGLLVDAAKFVVEWLAKQGAMVAGTIIRWVQMEARLAILSAQMYAATVANAARMAAAWISKIAMMVVQTLVYYIKMQAGIIVMAARMLLANVIAAAGSAAAWIAANLLMTAGIALLLIVIAAAVIFIVTHWTQIRNFIINAAKAVWTWIKTNWPLLLGILSNPIGAFIVFLLTRFPGIKTAIVNVWNGVKSFLEGLPGYMLNVGKSIIQGLINGIGAMLGSLGKKIGEVVATIKKIPVIGGLIGSPSPYFTLVGKAIGQGVIVGIDSTTASAIGSMRNMSNALRNVPFGSAKMSAPGGAGATGSALGAGGNIILYANPVIHINGVNASPLQVGSEVEKAIDRNNQKLVKMLRSGVFVPGMST